ncbi:DUF5316 family protein [Clostridium lacusfryxellense]|uniref:DUF5316 family protein n=1 Tax=Clostridium lacusfryxellense TaxID=205328 RepID=UPI001C0B6571|nr:DUF5316 family protein [Clostridium lacusfryxellense]MBU3111481.1 DUF5316 domain-containing protein [Clostridium lacusfryxellense]
MKKTIILTFIVMCFSVVLGKLFNNWMLTIKICGSIGLVCLGIALISNDTFARRDRLKSNNSISNEDKIIRRKISNFVMVLGSTNIILAVVMFLS